MQLSCGYGEKQALYDQLYVKIRTTELKFKDLKKKIYSRSTLCCLVIVFPQRCSQHGMGCNVWGGGYSCVW